ncbi:MAG: hypothetical protein SF028_12135 [Candidatus Sumerlaeia bacterium]|nr:hypothetical protein [Candidatus Sumerlaeia bacterium]
MIGLACFGTALAAGAARALRSRTREVDGPFYAWRGRLATDDALLLCVEEETPEAAFVAVRLLAHRGARRVLALGEVEAAPLAVGRFSYSLGDIVLPRSVIDATALEPLLAYLPNNATGLPFAYDEKSLRLCGGIIGAPATNPALATIRQPLRSPWLANHLFEKHGIGFFDRYSSGAMDAALDAKVSLYRFAFLTGSIRMGHEAPIPQFQREKTVFEALENFTGSLPDAKQVMETR